MRRLYLRKGVLLILCLVLMVSAGVSFYRSRHLKEPVVLGPGVSGVKKLSSYFSGIEGTVNDSNVYFLEGSEAGGTILILGGTHPEEPAVSVHIALFHRLSYIVAQFCDLHFILEIATLSRMPRSLAMTSAQSPVPSLDEYRITNVEY